MGAGVSAGQAICYMYVVWKDFRKVVRGHKTHLTINIDDNLGGVVENPPRLLEGRGEIRPAVGEV